MTRIPVKVFVAFVLVALAASSSTWLAMRQSDQAQRGVDRNERELKQTDKRAAKAADSAAMVRERTRKIERIIIRKEIAIRGPNGLQGGPGPSGRRGATGRRGPFGLRHHGERKAVGGGVGFGERHRGTLPQKV